MADARPAQRRQRTLDAVKRLLLRGEPGPAAARGLRGPALDRRRDPGAARQPGREPARARLLLLVNYRPEYQHAWGSKTYYSQLRLDPLPPESAGELLERSSATTPGSSRSSSSWSSDEGNPFFLEESVRTLVETKALVGRARRVSADAAAGPGDPGARPRCRRSWRRASTGSPRRTSACSRPPRSSARTCRSRCSRRSPSCRTRGSGAGSPPAGGRVPLRDRLFPDLEYTFKHALTHEVAYGGLLQERRRALHARIVEAIERSTRIASASTSSGSPTTPSAGRAAGRRRSHYLRQAGLKAAARSALPEAGSGSSRRSTRSRHCRRARRRWSRPSTSASSCGRC